MNVALTVGAVAIAVVVIVAAIVADRRTRAAEDLEVHLWRLSRQVRAVQVAIGTVLLPTMRSLAETFKHLTEALAEEEGTTP